MGNDSSKGNLQQTQPDIPCPSIYSPTAVRVDQSQSTGHPPEPPPLNSRPFWRHVNGHAELHIPPLLEILNLSYQAVAIKECRGLVKALTENKSIRNVNLRGNALGTNEIGVIASLLETDETVESIDLSENNISDRGVKHLARAIAANPRLQLTELLLGYNKITDLGCHLLFDSLKNNSSIVTIDLRGNKQVSAHALHMMNCIRSRPEIVARGLNFESILSPTPVLAQPPMADQQQNPAYQPLPHHSLTHPTPTPSSSSLPNSPSSTATQDSLSPHQLQPPSVTRTPPPTSITPSQPRTRKALAKQQELLSHERRIEFELDQQLTKLQSEKVEEISGKLLETVFIILQQDDNLMARFVELSVGFRQGSIPVTSFYTYALESLKYDGIVQLMPMMICALHTAPDKQLALKRAHIEYQCVKALISNTKDHNNQDTPSNLSATVPPTQQNGTPKSRDPPIESHSAATTVSPHSAPAASILVSATPVPAEADFARFRPQQNGPPPMTFASTITLKNVANDALLTSNASTRPNPTTTPPPPVVRATSQPQTTQQQAPPIVVDSYFAAAPSTAPTRKASRSASGTPTTSTTPAPTVIPTSSTPPPTTPANDTSVQYRAMQAKAAAMAAAAKELEAKELAEKQAAEAAAKKQAEEAKRAEAEKREAEKLAAKLAAEEAAKEAARKKKEEDELMKLRLKEERETAKRRKKEEEEYAKQQKEAERLAAIESARLEKIRVEAERVKAIEAEEEARRRAKDAAIEAAARELEAQRAAAAALLEQERKKRLVIESAEIEAKRLAEIEAGNAERKQKRREEKEKAALAARLEQERQEAEAAAAIQAAAESERAEAERVAQEQQAAIEEAAAKAARKAEKAARKEEEKRAEEVAKEAEKEAKRKRKEEKRNKKAAKEEEKARAAELAGHSIPVPPSSLFSSPVTPSIMTPSIMNPPQPKIMDEASATEAVRVWSARYTAQLPQIHLPPMPPPIPDPLVSSVASSSKFIPYEDEVKIKRLDAANRAKIAAAHAVYAQAQADAQKRDRDQAAIKPDICSLLLHLHTIFPVLNESGQIQSNQPHPFSVTLGQSDRSPSAIKKAFLKASLVVHPDKQNQSHQERVHLSKAIFPILQASYQHFTSINKV